MLYIQKNLGFYYSEVELGETYKTGTTLDDYDNGAFLLLNNDQVGFHEIYPDATPVEVWNGEIPSMPKLDELESARIEKLAEIAMRDSKSNKFFISVISEGKEVTNSEFWMDKDLRNSLLNVTLPALQKNGDTTTKLWSDTTPPRSIEVPIDWALNCIPIIEVYAKETYDLMQGNIAKVYEAQTVEEVDAIDVESVYPPYLTFTLNLTPDYNV